MENAMKITKLLNDLKLSGSMLDEKSTEELIKDLLEKRGQESQHQIEKFMNPEYKDFKNPFDFENMEKIVNRIISARENKEKNIYLWRL